MTFPLTQFLFDLREAAAVWLALVAFAVLVTGVMLAPGRVRGRRGRATRRPGSAKARPLWRRVRRAPSRNQLAARAGELVRYAQEVTVAADRAALTAERRWDGWLAAQDAEDAAWRAYRAADDLAARVLAAAAFPLPATPRTPAEYAHRERYLHRAVTAAYRRGELTAEQLADALTHRNGWDPTRHPFEQDAALSRAARPLLLHRYLEASAAERRAWQAAEVAALSRRSLEAEAFAARVRAGQAWSAATAAAPRRLRLGAARRPTLAVR